jgi:hypothetical protein
MDSSRTSAGQGTSEAFAVAFMEQRGFVHLGYLPPSSGWVLPLLSRLRASPSSALRQRLSRWGESKLSELGLAVSSKIQIVGLSAWRVEAAIGRIALEIQEREGEVVPLINSDAAIQIWQEGILFEALLDIEAFLFEMRSRRRPGIVEAPLTPVQCCRRA